MITRKRVLGERNRVFTDDAMAHAILDRLAGRAEGFQLEETSFRETHRRHADRVTRRAVALLERQGSRVTLDRAA